MEKRHQKSQPCWCNTAAAWIDAKLDTVAATSEAACNSRHHAKSTDTKALSFMHCLSLHHCCQGDIQSYCLDGC